MRILFLSLFFLITVKSFSQEKDLAFYIEKAQTNSPLLKDLSNQMQLNSIDSLLVIASFKPQIAANLNAYVAPNHNGFGYDTALSNGQSVSGLVGFNQKIIGKNRIDTQAETFKIIKEGLALNKKIAIKDLNKVIIAQYVTAYGSAEQVVYNQKMVELLKNEAVILKKLTQNSIYKQTDYLIFLATLKQQELQVLQLKQQYQNDLGLLNYLSGETDVSFVNLVKPAISLKSIQKEQNTLFEKQFETDSLKISNQNKLIDNSYKPSLSFLGDAGYMSSFVNQGYKNFGFSIGLGLSIPIYDGNQKTLLHQKNETALATNLAYKNNFNKQFEQQLLLLNQRLKQTEEIQNQLQSQLQISDALIEANKKLLLSGDAQITDFMIAIGNVISINNTISQNKINTFQLINEINYWSSND
ncbi:TolC family protein [Flavobacterium muglaense]|uniref:TolC family protein n=1 Tax=Flavobacterium muglaense TaxID=2764716 RepID=A0A923SGR8_9FLAO|nr:TolC family protein [Flavobacterium muglaense]MBC5838711.1 TolC family protein [Flavobacterium muglaense]MBC5845996.1 TolC family protein [Flavobacterium muglaense]